MKILVLFSVLISTASWAKLRTVEMVYADIYASALIEKFDQELDHKISFSDQKESILDSMTYFKLLAARDLIESSHEHTGRQLTKSLLEVTDMHMYHTVVAEISKRALEFKKLKESFQKETQDLVLYPSISSAGNVTGNTFPKDVWSLTFDDGPHETRTDEVIKNLYLHNISATFFVLLRQADKYPQAIDNILHSDMELALHSYNHLNLDKVSAEVAEYEIGESKQELENRTQKKISLFRLPYGAGMRNPNLREIIKTNKMLHVFWNVDTLDWKDKDPESILARVKKQMQLTPRKSGIILFHDIHKQSVIASELVMQYLHETTKKVCQVGEVISFINGQEQNCL